MSNKCKSKGQWDTTSRSLEWLWAKPWTITKVGKDVEKSEASCAAGGKAKSYKQFGHSLAVLKKKKLKIEWQ